MTTAINKKLEEYKKNKPVQLEFFFLDDEEKREKHFSRSIEIYDLAPKYNRSKRLERVQDKYLEVINKNFAIGDDSYNIVISPARITKKNKNGEIISEKDFYPGRREELVEDALRKLACDGNGIYLNDGDKNYVGVVFTLYELQQELKRTGHNYNITQIKDAILICNKTNLEISFSGGRKIKSSTMFEDIGLTTQSDWVGTGKKDKAYVRFNSLITESINSKQFRLYNYEKSMLLKADLARFLHKKMAMRFKQASALHHYSPLLSSIIRDSGSVYYDKISNNIRQLRLSLDEMKKSEILSSYKIENIYNDKDKRKITDAKITLIPHFKFVKEMKFFNKKYRELKNSELLNKL